MNFKELKQYDQSSNATIGRKKEDQIKYGQYLAQCKITGNNIGDKLKELFSNLYKDRSWIITKNKFPYDIDDQVVHLLIWLNPNKTPSEQEIRKYLHQLVGDDYIMFKNTLDKKSIPSVDHFHLFVKIKHMDVEAIELDDI